MFGLKFRLAYFGVV